MLKNVKRVLASGLVLATVASNAIFVSADDPATINDELLNVTKTAAINDDGSYTVRLKVPGGDGQKGVILHDEVILMVDGSYSGDDEWNSMVDAIVTIGETVLNGNGNTQLTLMAFGMGDNEVLVHVKDADELANALGELPGSLLYGRSSTNCEAGFTGVSEYIAAHDDTLNDVYVMYISDGEVNTDETPANFYDWKNNGWHRFSEEVIITENFKNECGAIMEGANRSDAYLAVFGEGDVETIYANATYEMMDAYNARIWADVFAEAELNPTELHPVSDVERAFVDYDNKHNTYIQDNFYYALVGRGYPNKTQRTIDAGNALAANEKVEALYIIDNNRTTAWMETVGGENFIPAGSVANVIPTLEENEILNDLAIMPYNDVVVTDYMSKWVDLDTDSISIVDDTTGSVIYTAIDGWLIAEEDRPTALEAPVEIAPVNPIDYEDGGADVIGNMNGDIYKLTWHVKDGALLRSENYSLTYNIDIDVKESGFCAGANYPANGDTTVTYTDDEGSIVENEIKVPEVSVPENYFDYIFSFSSGEVSNVSFLYLNRETGEIIFDHKVDVNDQASFYIDAMDGYISVVFVKQATSGMLWTSEKVTEEQQEALLKVVKKNNKSYKKCEGYASGEGDKDLTYSIGNKKKGKTKTVTYSFDAVVNAIYE